MVALTQTLLSVFGSKVVLPSTGVLMNNGIMWFDPRPGSPNSLAPGKRPLTNMCPTIARRDGKAWFAIGASGGRKILPAVFQISSFLIDHGMTLENAFHQPRIDASGGDTVGVDPRLPDAIRSALAEKFPVSETELVVYPTNFACPSAVFRDPKEGTHFGYRRRHVAVVGRGCRMINAAIVGLGRWGQNLVNSVQGKSDEDPLRRGRAAASGERARVRGAPGPHALRAITAKCSPIRRSTRSCSRRRTRCTPSRSSPRQSAANPYSPRNLSRSLHAALPRRCAAAAKNNVTLGVGFNWRFQPALQEIRKMLEDGRLGKLLHIEGNFCGPSVYRFGKDHWRQQRDEGPAGGMTGRGVHVVDAMMYLAGQIDTVHAQSHRLALDYGIDDTTIDALSLQERRDRLSREPVIATAETWRMQVFGSKGWAEVGDVEHLTTWQMKVCFVDPAEPHHAPQAAARHVPAGEHRARGARELRRRGARRPSARRRRAATKEHGVAVLEADPRIGEKR